MHRISESNLRELEEELEHYKDALDHLQLAQATRDNRYYRARLFIQWLRDDFTAGRQREI